MTTLFDDLAGDLTGEPGRTPPLVLLHGLTFDRTSWHPVLAELTALDPLRRPPARSSSRPASRSSRSRPTTATPQVYRPPGTGDLTRVPSRGLVMIMGSFGR